MGFFKKLGKAIGDVAADVVNETFGTNISVGGSGGSGGSTTTTPSNETIFGFDYNGNITKILYNGQPNVFPDLQKAMDAYTMMMVYKQLGVEGKKRQTSPGRYTQLRAEYREAFQITNPVAVQFLEQWMKNNGLSIVGQSVPKDKDQTVLGALIKDVSTNASPIIKDGLTAVLQGTVNKQVDKLVGSSGGVTFIDKLGEVGAKVMNSTLSQWFKKNWYWVLIPVGVGVLIYANKQNGLTKKRTTYKKRK